MTSAGARGLEAVLGILGDARSNEPTETFTQPLVDQLVDLVGCDFARYFEFDTARRIDIAFIPSSAEEASLPEMSQKLRESEWDIWLSHPCYRASLGEPSGIFRLSDLARRKRIAPEDIDGVHEDIGGPRGDRLSIQIDAPGWTGFVFDRCDSHFHKREHELAHVLQIHLGQLWAEGVSRHRLRAALTVLEHGDGAGVLLLGVGGTVEFASTSAQRLVRDHFGASTERLPIQVEQWYLNDRARPLTLPGKRSNLIIEAVSTSALLLHEQPSGIELLTHRERQVMRCVAAGLSNPEIGQTLWIEPTTVRKHLEHIYEKLGVRSRTAALAKTRAALDYYDSQPGSDGAHDPVGLDEDGDGWS
jgi:DNA-binding CsgD family transcriptional regulator